MTQDLLPLRILGVSASPRGHVIPMLYVMEACKRSGHNVTLCTEDYGVEDVKPLAAKVGVELLPLATGKTKEQATRERFEKGKMGFLTLRENTSASTNETVARLKPDVVLCDFMTVAGMEAAIELGIPLVVNCPAAMGAQCALLGLPDSRRCYQLWGIHVRLSCFSGLRLAVFLNFMGLRDFVNVMRPCAKKAKILLHSFFGLEEPMELPPQIRMIGPVLPSASELAGRFPMEHAELCQWLRAEGAAPTIMITTGTLTELHPWQVRELFFAVREAGLRAVWSLKAEQQAHLPRTDDPAFWIRAWLPQAELLADPAVVAVVSHCGWGGTLESLCMGKPLICMPFFGDQPLNARMLVSAGCGELISRRLPALTFLAENTYVEDAFDAKSVAPILKKVVEDPRYRSAAQRMQQAALHTGGAAQAAMEVEWSARYGNDYICSAYIHRVWGGNPFGGVFAVCFSVATVVWIFRGFELKGLAAGLHSLFRVVVQSVYQWAAARSPCEAARPTLSLRSL